MNNNKLFICAITMFLIITFLVFATDVIDNITIKENKYVLKIDTNETIDTVVETHTTAENTEDIDRFLEFYSISKDNYTEEEIEKLYYNYGYLYRNGISYNIIKEDLMLLIDDEVKDQIEFETFLEYDIQKISWLYMYDKFLPEIWYLKSREDIKDE